MRASKYFLYPIFSAKNQLIYQVLGNRPYNTGMGLSRGRVKIKDLVLRCLSKTTCAFYRDSVKVVSDGWSVT